MADNVPGTSSSPLSPLKKNPRGKFVGSAQKQIIVNLYKSLLLENPDIKYKEMVGKLAKDTGIGRESVSKTLSEYKATGTVTSPNKKKARLNILEKTSSEDVLKIRKLVHSFWLNRQIPNLKTVLNAVNNDETLPNFKATTLNRLLHRMEFKYVARKRNSALIEQPHIIQWRQQYLRQIQDFRAEKRPIFYLDETWINAGDCKGKQWADTSVTSPRNAAERGLSTGIPAPLGKDNRLIIAHIGSKDGFVPGALLCLEANKKVGDYHQEMNGDTFFEWFRSLLPLLPDGAVVVLDIASYHSVKKEKYPTLSWKKSDIIAWLEGKGETLDPRCVKVDLLDIVQKYNTDENIYVIDEYAKQHGCTVLRLPPYHCELNPIEMAWAQVKEYIRKHNVSYKLADVRRHVDAAIENVSVQNWVNYIGHAIKEEKRFYDLDHITDAVLEECPDWSYSSDDSDIDVAES